MANSKSLVIFFCILGIFQTVHCGHHHGRDEDPRAMFDSLFDSIQGKVQIQNSQESHAAKSSKSSQQQLNAGNSMGGIQQQQSSQNRNQEQADQPPQPAPIQAPQPPPPIPISKKSPVKAAPGYDQSRDAQDASNNDAPPPQPPAPKPRPTVPSDDASPKPRPPAPSNGYSDRTRSSSKFEKKESIQQSSQMSQDSNQQASQADNQDMSQTDKKNGNQADNQSNDQSSSENQHAHAIPENDQRSTQVQNSNSAQQVDTDSQDQNDNAKPAQPAPVPVRPRQAPTVPQTQNSNMNGNLQPQQPKPSSASLQSQGAALVGSRSAKVPTAASMVSSAMEEDDEDEMDSSPFSSRVGMIQPDMLKVFAQMSGSFVPTACQTDSDCTVKGFACSRLLNKCVPGTASSTGQAKCGTAQLCSTDADCCAGERCDSFGGLLERQRCRRGDSKDLACQPENHYERRKITSRGESSLKRDVRYVGRAS